MPSDTSTGDGTSVIRIVRIIARLNVGGPAIQAITLTRLLRPLGYETRLVRGREGPEEGSMDYLADELGVAPTLIPSLRRDPGVGDLATLLRLVWIMRRDRPQIVHTHAAKGGTLGRLATLVAFPLRSRRPILIHTFHGHSLTGYFSARAASVFLAIERWLARETDVLVAVSPEVRDDLIRLEVADRERFAVVRLGFDLAQFREDSHRTQRRAALRAGWGLGCEDEVVTVIARLVPIKRVDRFLRVAQLIADRRPRARFVVVGDGELRDALTESEVARKLEDRLVWAGFCRDIPGVCFASDVVMLTSDNEGTPVSLIEAQAAAVPVVGTDVGGVRSTVQDGQTGIVAAADDEAELARAVISLLEDPAWAQKMGAAGREHATSVFNLERLVADHDQLYRRLKAGRSRS